MKTLTPILFAFVLGGCGGGGAVAPSVGEPPLAPPPPPPIPAGAVAPEPEETLPPPPASSTTITSAPVVTETAPPPAAAPPPPAAERTVVYATGRWVYADGYGWIWIPNEPGSVVVDSVPYVYLYTPMYGWSWYVSPWGFGGYTYGGWVRRPWRPYGWHDGWVASPRVVVRIGPRYHGHGHDGYHPPPGHRPPPHDGRRPRR